MKIINFKKVSVALVCLILCSSSCQEYYDYSDIDYQCAIFSSYEWLYDHSDFVYLIELGDVLGTWTSPNDSLEGYRVFDVWGYSVIETYKGSSDNYYMFFMVSKYKNSSVAELVTDNHYYVFLNDYSYLDDRTGFPDYFISIDYCSYSYGLIPA